MENKSGTEKELQRSKKQKRFVFIKPTNRFPVIFDHGEGRPSV